MSTKALREFLFDELVCLCHEMHPCDGPCYSCRTRDDASKELEAIERAAVTMDKCLPIQVFGVDPQRLSEALNLMLAIATEAQARKNGGQP